MRKLWILGFLVCGLIEARAQKEYFFYFQSENYSPFFLKMNNKVYSAGAEGYLILPRLVDSTHTFSIGRNGAQAVESRFTLPVNGKDRGFLIREQDGRLQLFDLQSLRTIQPQELGSRSGTSFIKKDDPFTRLLALAADDTSLLYAYTEPEKPKSETAKAPQPITETETIKDPVKTGEDVVTVPKKADTTSVIIPAQQDTRASRETAAAPIADSVIVQTVRVPEASHTNQVPDSLTLKPPTIDPDARAVAEKRAPTDSAASPPDPAKDEASPPPPYYKKSVVMRKSESSTTEGFGLVFIDSHEAGVDTIRLLIPNPKFAYQKPAAEEPDDTKKFLEVTTEGVASDKEAAVDPPVSKNACRAVATNADFLRLRRYMAGKVKEDDMVTEAKKYFRSKCFATEQVKHLSALFLTDRGKYLFFEAASTHIADPDSFPSLQSEIKDAYFIDRFKVLSGN